jgi:LemA protein
MYIFILLIIVILVLYVISVYNNAVRRKNEVEKAFGSIDAMLKKRYDLIPNLVETVKQYSSYESKVLTEVTRLRAQLVDQLSTDEKIELHNSMSKHLNSLMVSVENYPDLKASQNFLRLQSAWNETEEQISASRRYYNAAVAEYNNSIQTFPANVLIDSSRFTTKKVLEIETTERQNISAKELFNS